MKRVKLDVVDVCKDQLIAYIEGEGEDVYLMKVSDVIGGDTVLSSYDLNITKVKHDRINWDTDFSWELRYNYLDKDGESIYLPTMEEVKIYQREAAKYNDDRFKGLIIELAPSTKPEYSVW